MKRMLGGRVAAVGLGLATTMAASAPVELLFGEYERHAMALSPSGRKMAATFIYGEKEERRRGLAVVDLATKETRNVVRQRDANVISFWWAGDERLVTRLAGRWSRPGLFAFDADGKNLSEILPLTLTDPSDRRMLLARSGVIFVNRTDESVLAARAPRGGRRQEARRYLYDGLDPAPAVYRVNTRSGEFSIAAKDPGVTLQWIVDRRGRPRVAWGYEAEAFKADGSLVDATKVPRQRAYWLDDAGKAEPIEGLLLGPDEAAAPLGFEAEGERFLFVGRQGGDRAALHAFDPRTKRIEGPLAASETVDLTAANAFYSPHDGTVVALVVPEGRPRVVWLDARLKALAAEINAALPEFVNTFTSWTPDLKRVLVHARSSVEPGRFYLFDAAAETLEEVTARSHALRKAGLVPVAPVAIPVQGGETVHGFLTRPQRERPGSLVLLVHGGPWERDTADYDPVVQFFATRGHAVLQVNFRGSTGYGRRFEALGRKQFGTGMIDDVLDALDWAIAQGIAAKDRVAIAGASYGGYAVLRAMTVAPERFKAGVALLPVADVARQISDYKRKEYQIAHAHWSEWVGDPERELAGLKEISPIYHLARLRAPLFVSFGEEDERIDYSQSVDLVRQLQAHRKKVTTVVATDAGHNFGDIEMQIKVFKELERFLAQNFPP